jgi:hypothetical protein
VLAGWESFQHYKDRDPTWVKLYRDLLTSESWVLGTDSSRLVQVASILLAARYQNATPHKFDLFRKVASLDITETQFNAAIAHLAATKFIGIQGDVHPSEQHASNVLAKCSSEKSREEKSREEKIQRGARSCPDSFVITDEMRAWAATECPGIDLDRETATFKDYTFASVKTDWLKTWRNWMRKAKPLNGSRPTRYEETRKRALAWNPDAPTTNPLLIEAKR